MRRINVASSTEPHSPTIATSTTSTSMSTSTNPPSFSLLDVPALASAPTTNPNTAALHEILSNKINAILPSQLDAIAKTLQVLDDIERRQKAIEVKCSWARLYPDPRFFDKASILAKVQKLKVLVAPLPRVARTLVPSMQEYIVQLDAMMGKRSRAQMEDLESARAAAEKLLYGLEKHAVLVQWRRDGFESLLRQVEGLVDLEDCHENVTVQRYFLDCFICRRRCCWVTEEKS
jgi:hypothetical protein